MHLQGFAPAAPIRFDGVLVGMIGERAEVRLDNCHLVRAAFAGVRGGFEAGRPIAVELLPDDVRGWRVAPHNPERP